MSAFCKIVSFTVMKTSLIFDVSVACVILRVLVKPDKFGNQTEKVDALWIHV